ncbi:MAG: CHAT domain-containing protein [bacterium]|nr:CHAT domain-containing protein [bacterium]
MTTRSGTRVVPLEADRASIEPWIKAFLGLSEPEGRPAVRLYRETVQQALEELDPRVRKLVLVPDGLLNLLPFSALRPSLGSPPLIDRFELTLVPSADLWLRWRERQGDAGASDGRSLGALVLANPAISNAAEPARARASGLESAADLGRLPFAEREGRSVARRFRGPTRLVANEEASEAFLKRENLDRYGVVHFAAHSVTDSERPQRSAILLAPGDDTEDGFLRPAEIVRLQGLEGKLVVLSSCNSASGNVLRGEGVLSLARAFFEAGAHAVVGSLWRLDDREAAAFFEDFYAHLAEGQTVSQAVASTQRRWISKRRPASAWAGLVVLGNGDLVPMPEGRAGRISGIWVASAAALGLLLALWCRRSLGRLS